MLLPTPCQTSRSQSNNVANYKEPAHYTLRSTVRLCNFIRESTAVNMGIQCRDYSALENLDLHGQTMLRRTRVFFCTNHGDAVVCNLCPPPPQICQGNGNGWLIDSLFNFQTLNSKEEEFKTSRTKQMRLYLVTLILKQILDLKLPNMSANMEHD